MTKLTDSIGTQSLDDGRSLVQKDIDIAEKGRCRFETL